MRKSVLALLLICALSITACSVVGGSNLVPTTGDTANDPSAAQQFVTDVAGSISTEIFTVTDAVCAVTGGASLLTGNLPWAGLVAPIDGMIQCYENVGALASKVYVQANVSELLQGQIPSAGALGVLNQDRLINH